MISAHVCARLAQLAYLDNGDVLRGHLLGIGFALYGYYDEGGTQAFLAISTKTWPPSMARSTGPDQEGLHVVAWRGSDEAGDWRDDARYIKTDFPGGGRVHRGFLEVSNRVHDEIAADLVAFDGPNSRVFVGHSLGAAPATLGAVTLNPDLVMVYGSPRVGNTDFVKRIRCRLVRHENWFDPVPFVPTRTSPRQAFHAFANDRPPTLYKHAGIRVRTPGFGHSMRRYLRATSKGD